MLTGWNEYDAAVHVLEDDLIRERTERHILRTDPRGIRFDALLEESSGWSHGDRLMVLAALDLWNGRAVQVDDTYCLRALCGSLEFDHIERVLDGVRILCNQPIGGE